MHIIQIATELAPIAKVGGLADVLFGLSKELKRQGHTVEILLPKYDCIQYGQLANLKVEQREVWSYEGPNRYPQTIWSAEVDHLRILLLEPHHPKYYFSRGMIYGCADDIDRFTYFCRASLEYLYKTGKHPDCIHIHDWPTSLIALLYKEMYASLGLKVGRIVLTIHNLEHQGKCTPSQLTKMGLRGDDYLTPEKLQDPHQGDTINLLKGGIEYADFITTVSPNYEREIKTIDGGCGLHAVLMQKSKKLKGILNGIDETYWNPETDPHLIAHYKLKNSSILKAKEENKQNLRRHFGLKEGNFPLVASVTRLVLQKGPELIIHAIFRTLEKKGQFILVGAALDVEMERIFKQLKEKLRDNSNVAIHLDYDEAIAHLTFAGSDLFLIPSLFEPCGLTQMIALRYGSVPIARMTGGLVDTVFDIQTAKIPEEKRNGFTFDFPDKEGINWALDRAIACWMEDKKRWQKIVLQGMSYDFSWKKPAQEYLSIY